MHRLTLNRLNCLAGLCARLDLAVWPRPPEGRPTLPSSPRLRRDIGLPEIEADRPIYTFIGHRF